MEAVGFSEFGGPEVLRLVSLPVPVPGPGEVRVRVVAAAVNPTDLAFRSGRHRSMPEGVSPPYVPGMDLAGVVDVAGADVPWAPGDRVMAAVSPWAAGGGAQAEFVVVAADALARMPGQMSLQAAATLPMNALTVRAALDMIALRPGQVLGVAAADLLTDGRVQMAVFVLVHGAWGGAHGFRKVRGPLRAAGHEVFTPSLTGIGERAHLTSPQVCLTTHIADVVNAVWYEDLGDIVLLGFSYGGFVVTGALEHIGDRVRHLVYLDAFVPDDGDTVAGIGGAGGDYGAPELGRDWLVPPHSREFDDPAEAAWADARRTPHPAGCFTEPVRLARPLEDYPFTRTYIKATGEPRPESGGPFWAAADRVMASPAWRYREISTNHMIPSNRPAELARLLLELT